MRYSRTQVRLVRLRPNSRYQVLVQATNDFGAGPTEAVAATTMGDGNLPSNKKMLIFYNHLHLVPSVGPSGLRCRSLGSTSLKVDWKPLSAAELRGEAEGYLVHYQHVTWASRAAAGMSGRGGHFPAHA